MFLYGLTLVSLLALVISVIRDRRSLWNPIFLIASLNTLYISFGKFVYENNWLDLHYFFLGSTYLVISFLVLVGGLFLIYNGFILLQKEGKSLANYLSLLQGVGVAILLFLGLVVVCTYLLPPMEYQWLTLIFILAFVSFAVEAFHLAEKSDVKLIASGGQGPDELISEAQAIADYLESIDFPVDRLIWEDKSTTTYENLLFPNNLDKN